MNEFKTKKIEEVIDYISNLDYGDILSHKELASKLNIEYKSPEYFSSMNKVKKELLKRGKALESIYKAGYKVALPDNYSNMAIKQYKLGFNRLSKGEKILQYAPVKSMSEDGLIAYRNVTDKACQLHASMAGGIVELNLLNKQKVHPLLKDLNK